MQELMGVLARHFSFSQGPGREFGIEIEPRFAGADYIRRIGTLGLSRVSAGLQDFDPAGQAGVNGIQSVAQPSEVLEAARQAASVRPAWI